MRRAYKPLILALCVSGGVFLSACSSSPSEEELAQLRERKSQVESLKTQVANKQKQKADLEKQIAEKNGKLQQCQADQDAVKKAGGGQ